MNTINKAAIDRAEYRLKEIIKTKVQRWQDENPAPCRELTERDIAAIAISDPKWKANVLSAIADDRSWTCRRQMLDMSPMAAKEQKRREVALGKYNQQLTKYRSGMEAAAAAIVDKAVIAGMSAIDFASAVQKFAQDQI